MIWFGWVLWHTTMVGYLMPNPVYTYILNTYVSIWLRFMAYQQLYKAKSYRYVYSKYIILDLVRLMSYQPL